MGFSALKLPSVRLIRADIETAFARISKESALLERFLSIHEKKIQIVKKIVPQWNEGKISAIKQELELVSEFNQDILKISKELEDITKKERVLAYFIIKQKFSQMNSSQFEDNKGLMEKDKLTELAKDIEESCKHLVDLFESLIRLIELQNKTLKKKETHGAIAKDLIEKQFFYQLLLDETSLDQKIRQNVIEVLRKINSLIGLSEKEPGLVFKTIKKGDLEKRVVRKGLIIYEMRDPQSSAFDKFYRLYSKSFHADEIEEMDDLGGTIDYKWLKYSIKNDYLSRYHTIVTVHENKVLGFSYFSTIFVKEIGICFGHGWYTSVAEKYRNLGIQEKLYNFRRNLMEKDTQIFGASSLTHIFIDVNDPRKMTAGQVRAHVKIHKEDPNETIKRFKRMGFVPMNHFHITPDYDNNESIEYETLMMQPFVQQWIDKGGVTLHEYLKIYETDIMFGYGVDPRKDKNCIKVMQSIRQNALNGIVKFQINSK